jgi:hypothetical protein
MPFAIALGQTFLRQGKTWLGLSKGAQPCARERQPHIQALWSGQPAVPCVLLLRRFWHSVGRRLKVATGECRLSSADGLARGSSDSSCRSYLRSGGDGG